ncbi:MAG: DUF424 domain-containing protein [Candidatus Helarchaeota archaeon]
MNIQRMKNDTIVAICDSNLMGKTFQDGPLKLEVNERFYGTNRVSLQEGINGIKQGTNINLVGEAIITEAINQGILSKYAIIEISGIPHAIIIV